ncbi:MAG: hypothetical protein GX601_03125 [Anaerolineales bacterium]|nr:hypothetical protein [Anaerolineales bacterium]
MTKRFKVLRAIATIWKILAWVELILGIIAAVGVLVLGLVGMSSLEAYGYSYPSDVPWQLAGPLGGLIGAFSVLVGVVFWFLMLYAIGEVIYVLLAIEENTRQPAPQQYAE